MVQFNISMDKLIARLRLDHRFARLSTKRLIGCAVIASFIVIGSAILLRSHAMTPALSLEPEIGTAAGTTLVNDTAASGGKAVRFGSAAPPPSSPPPSGSVDPTTLANKFMMGFQGWFQCPGDGSPGSAWRHWFKGTPPSGTSFDAWPDTSELTATEKCDTGLKLPDGSPAYVFSDYKEQTVVRQMQWMKDNGIDGLMLQRFSSELSIPNMLVFRNQVTKNVMAGANTTGRTFTIMYDISGQDASTLVSTIQNDWKSLVDTIGVTSNPHYQREKGLPVVVIWGFGFDDRPGTPSDLNTLLNFFHNNPNPAYRATVMGGVNNDWRTNSTWASALLGFDIISPWTVGRYKMQSSSDTTSVKNWINNNTVPDITYAKQKAKMYLPVIWPGFSFKNGGGLALNSHPRYGGNFLWQQAYHTLQAQKNAGMPTMLYGAMLDEVNEGTAFFKQANSPTQWPSTLTMLSLNADGYTQIPKDWYLKVAGEVNKMTNGSIPLTPTMTITPR